MTDKKELATNRLLELLRSAEEEAEEKEARSSKKSEQGSDDSSGEVDFSIGEDVEEFQFDEEQEDLPGEQRSDKQPGEAEDLDVSDDLLGYILEGKEQPKSPPAESEQEDLPDVLSIKEEEVPEDSADLAVDDFEEFLFGESTPATPEMETDKEEPEDEDAFILDNIEEAIEEASPSTEEVGDETAEASESALEFENLDDEALSEETDSQVPDSSDKEEPDDLKELELEGLETPDERESMEAEDTSDSGDLGEFEVFHGEADQFEMESKVPAASGLSKEVEKATEEKDIQTVETEEEAVEGDEFRMSDDRESLGDFQGEERSTSDTEEEEDPTGEIDEEDEFADMRDEGGEVRQFIYRTDMASTSFLSKFLPKRYGIIGVDIGEYAIKYVEMAEGKGLVLNDFGYEPIPPDIREDPAARQRFIRETLESLLDETVREKAKFHVSATSSEINIRNIKMPKVSKSELKEAILWSSKKGLPFAVEDAIIDHTVLGETKEAGVDKLDVLVVAGLEKDIEDQIDFLKSIDITPRKLSLDPLAIWNAYSQFYEKTADDNVMIVDLGQQTSFISFINQGKLRFAREISIAGKDFTDALQGTIATKDERIKVNEELAVTLKTKYGIPYDDESGISTEEGIPYTQLSARFMAPLERLTKELQRSIEYYQKEMSHSTINRIFITGGSARLNNLTRYLNENLQGERVDVELMDPMEHIEFGKHIDEIDLLDQVAPALTVAIGLASDKKKELNLVPERLKRLARIAKLKFAAILAAAIIGIGMFGSSSYFAFRVNSAETKLQNASQEFAELEPQKKAYVQAVDRRNELVANLNQLHREIQTASIDQRPLKVLSNLIPPNFALESIDLKLLPAEDKIVFTFSGNVYAGVTAADVDLLNFIQHLESTGHFDEILLTNKRKFEQKGQTGMYFKLSCEIS